METKDFFPKKDVKVAWRRWDQSRTLASYCPFTLENGFELTSLTMTCAVCKKCPEDARCMRGDVEPHEGNMRVKSVVWCPPCNLLSYAQCDVVPRGSSAVIVPKRTPPYWSPWGEDNDSVRGGFGGSAQ